MSGVPVMQRDAKNTELQVQMARHLMTLSGCHLDSGFLHITQRI
jgi:hypothetical protein